MRTILCLLTIIIFSLNVQAQSDESIEKDDLFLQYRESYIDFKKQNYYKEYEISINNFVKELIGVKAKIDFHKAKDKERWLKKNISKTKFTSYELAIVTYNSMIESEKKLKTGQEEIVKLRENLLNKYDIKLVNETLSKYNLIYQDFNKMWECH